MTETQRDEIAEAVATKYGFPKLLSDMKECFGKTVMNMQLGFCSSLILFTDGTALFTDGNAFVQYGEIECEGGTVLSPNWSFILSYDDLVFDNETQFKIEKEYLDASRAKQAQDEEKKERAEYQRLKAKFESEVKKI